MLVINLNDLTFAKMADFLQKMCCKHRLLGWKQLEVWKIYYHIREALEMILNIDNDIYLPILCPHASNLNWSICFYQHEAMQIRVRNLESWGSSDFDQTGLVWRYQWDNSKSKISAPQNYPFRKYRRTKNTVTIYISY